MSSKLLYRECPKCLVSKMYEENEEYCPPCRPQAPVRTKDCGKSYYDMGLKIGDKIYFIPKPEYVATISGEFSVMFEGKEWNIKNLVILLFERIGNMRKAESYRQGGSGNEQFKYDDQDLSLYTRWYRVTKQ